MMQVFYYNKKLSREVWQFWHWRRMKLVLAIHGEKYIVCCWKEKNMVYYIERDKGMIHRGNWHRIKECMKKAQQGQEITIGFLGGSITQGRLALKPVMLTLYTNGGEKVFRRLISDMSTQGSGGPLPSLA
jgi:hypothetical protein